MSQMVNKDNNNSSNSLVFGRWWPQTKSNCPFVGIVDWGEVARAYGRNFENLGGKIYLDFEVSKFDISESSEGKPVKWVSGVRNWTQIPV